MIFRQFLAALFAAAALAQAPPPPAAQILNLDPEKPDQVVARLDGQPVTAADYQEFILALDPKAREAARNNGVEMLRYYGWLRRMGALAEERKLHTREPLRTQLETARLQLLSNAMAQVHEYDEVVTPFEQRGYYQQNLQNYTAVNVKIIYLPPGASPTEDLQVKRRMEDIHARIKAGASFVDMVKQYSRHEESKAQDGDLGEIRMSDQIPQNIKDLVFAMKDGSVSEPARLPNGHYLFQRVSSKVEPFDAVKDAIFTDIKQKRNAEWVSKIRESVQVEVLPAPAGAAASDPARVAARLDGKPVTAAALEQLLAAMDENLRRTLRDSPSELLRGVGFMRRMTEMAEKQGVDKRSPYRRQLEITRLQALANALMQSNESEMQIPEAEIKAIYDKFTDRFTMAKLKIIFFGFANPDEEKQALAKAEAVAAKLKAGADFVAMVKEHSGDLTSKEKDGDYGPVRRSDEIPDNAKEVIFGLKPGQVSAPARLPNGYYIFKLLESVVEPFDAVKAELGNQMRTARNRQWMSNLRTQVAVEVVNAPAPEAPKPQAPK
jgi:parvulin-like peptidyl-prolyl isomerase